MYATPGRKTDGIASGDLQHYLRLWRFGQYYKLSADQLPGVLCPEALDVSTLKFQRWSHCARVTGARIWLFSLPSGQLVTSLSLDAQCELIDTIDLLEDCYFGDIEIGDQSLAEYAHAFAVQLGADSAAQANNAGRAQLSVGAIGGGSCGTRPAAEQVASDMLRSGRDRRSPRTGCRSINRVRAYAVCS